MVLFISRNSIGHYHMCSMDKPYKGTDGLPTLRRYTIVKSRGRSPNLIYRRSSLISFIKKEDKNYEENYQWQAV